MFGKNGKVVKPPQIKISDKIMTNSREYSVVENITFTDYNNICIKTCGIEKYIVHNNPYYNKTDFIVFQETFSID